MKVEQKKKLLSMKNNTNFETLKGHFEKLVGRPYKQNKNMLG